MTQQQADRITAKSYRVNTGAGGYITAPFFAYSVEGAIETAQRETMARSGTDKAVRSWLQVLERGVWVWVD